jgi:hypothetical protein
MQKGKSSLKHPFRVLEGIWPHLFTDIFEFCYYQIAYGSFSTFIGGIS